MEGYSNQDKVFVRMFAKMFASKVVNLRKHL